MEKAKVYRFNEHGICINPDTEIVYNKDKCYAEFSFAEVNGGWVFGTEFWMTLSTVEAYGVHGYGAWNGADPKTLSECKTSAIQEAIEFFSEPGRKQKCKGILLSLNNRLTE